MIVDEFDLIDYEAGASDEILGAECQSCARLLRWKFFPRDSSRKTGHGPQCYKCLEAPRLSIEEHVSRLSEMNYNSEGTKRQRHSEQETFHLDRSGQQMQAAEFLVKLRNICPSLYATQGGIAGDVALYVTGGVPKPEWNHRDFKYLGYLTFGLMPEYSEYEFDKQRDILLRATNMGWRSVLLRFIESKVLTEEQCDKEFGRPSGFIADVSWFKKLQQFRTSKNLYFL